MASPIFKRAGYFRPAPVDEVAGGSSSGAPQSVSTFRGPVGRLRHRCPLCPAAKATTGPRLLRCAACAAFRYCGREHQVAHRPLHKSACTRIKKARAKLAREDDAVRNATPDFMTPANAFETEVGRFWGIVNTRDYMRARFALARELLSLGTLDGVREALDHLRDMLTLCRGDNLGVRDMVPALMLRLDLDQECYDFVKWWATCDPDGRYDWGDTTLPYLDIRGADVLEAPDFLLGKHKPLNHIIALLILKLKLLVDIRNLKLTRMVVAGRLPVELRQQIERDVVRSPLSARLQRGSHAALLEAEERLLAHAGQMASAVHQNTINRFEAVLFDPDEALAARPAAYSPLSWEELALAMQNTYPAWWETEGVLELMYEARTLAARDLEDSEDDMEGLRRPGFGRGRTAEQLVDDESAIRVWEYLDDVVANVSFLGLD